MNCNRSLFSYVLVFTAQQASAAIVTDGLWTGNDWYDNANQLGVQNGVPYSNDSIK